MEINNNESLKNEPLREGSSLQGGKYRIVRVIGRGGFGITYLADHTRLKKKVAVKEFFPKIFCGRKDTTSNVRITTEDNVSIVGRLRNKFLKEAEHIAKMDCPYIVRIVDVFEENDTAYYVMDYIEGQSLSDMVKKKGPLGVNEAVRYVANIGEALEYIHAKRINHLDVKPANIMVRSKDDTPILIDFGLSKQYDTTGKQTSTTPVGISHGYAPIEQYADGGVKEFSPQTDVYALGATLYYLLSGKTPAQASDVLNQGLTFPPSVPDGLRGPISKAMSAGRQSRYPTVRAFIADLTADETLVTQLVEPQVTSVQNAPGDEWESPETSGKSDEKPSFKTIWVVSTILFLLIGGVFLYVRNSSDSSGKNFAGAESAAPVDSVTNTYYRAVLGDCSYTGEIDSEGKPNGRGKAEFYPGGVASSYEGEWIHGEMQGQAVYKMSNGDIFKGIFRDNKFSSGRYTTSGGDYYEGTFIDEQPYMGAWFDKSGRMVSKVIKGKES